MAGTGDLSSLRQIRRLRWCVDESVTYGTHMALHMSIGLLFLGGGRASLSRSKEGIAALLVSCFPCFPKSVDDNQHYLQPLRHLWVLAVSWRGLQVIDVATGKQVPVPVTVHIKEDVDYTTLESFRLSPSTLQFMSPCLLPPLSDITSIHNDPARYYPIDWNVSQNMIMPCSHVHHFLFVKRRSGHLSYSRQMLSAKNGSQQLKRALATWAYPQSSNIGENIVRRRINNFDSRPGGHNRH